MWGCGPGDRNTLLGPGGVLDLCYDEPSSGHRQSDSPSSGTPVPRASQPGAEGWAHPAVAFPAVCRCRLRGPDPLTAPPPPSRLPERGLPVASSSLSVGMFCGRKERRGAPGLRPAHVPQRPESRLLLGAPLAQGTGGLPETGWAAPLCPEPCGCPPTVRDPVLEESGDGEALGTDAPGAGVWRALRSSLAPFLPAHLTEK